MSSSMQLTMNAGIIDEGAGHLGTHIGNIETYRADLKSECSRVLGNLNGGAGHEQHGLVMRKVDSLIDEHISALGQHKTGMSNASGTAAQTSQRMISNLGQTAI